MVHAFVSFPKVDFSNLCPDQGGNVETPLIFEVA